MDQIRAASGHSDRVSQLMGSYLLRGYALLDQYCDVCTTPLMRDPQKKLLCVSCHLTQQSQQSAAKNDAVITSKSEDTSDTGYSCTAALRQKLDWAVKQLMLTSDVSQGIQLNAFIKGLAENISLVEGLKIK